jgi:hypothetical protein
MNCSTSLCPPTVAIMILHQVATNQTHREPARLPSFQVSVDCSGWTDQARAGSSFAIFKENEN